VLGEVPAPEVPAPELPAPEAPEPEPCVPEPEPELPGRVVLPPVEPAPLAEQLPPTARIDCTFKV